MPSFSEEIKARYEKIESETDEFGRVIVLKRLRPSEAHMVRKLAVTDRPNLLGDVMIAACVRSLDDKVFAAPRTAADIDILFNALDQEGLQAAARAWVRLMGFDQQVHEVQDDGAEAAKNSQATLA